VNQKRTFIKELGSYLAFRFRQIFFFAFAAVEVFVGLFSQLKSFIVSRIFWGRGNFYRTSFHLFISILSVSILLSGISSKLNIFGTANASGLGLNEGTIGQDDIFSQSGTSQALVLTEADQYDYVVYKHQISPGDTLSSIATYYGINIKTLMWANNITNQNASLTVGQVLKIPEIDGVFYTVKKGDTLDKIAKSTKSNVRDILDFNTKVFDIENPVVSEGMQLFIPGGQVIIPTRPPVVVAANSNPSGMQTFNIPKGTLINPLINCPGYVYIRGFNPNGHKGLDLAKGGGCWISAAGPGKVTRAGWGSYGEGWHVVIQHDYNIKTRYYHGERRFAVSVGDTVKAGQPILYMGSSGQSTGTHLHFEVEINGVRVNPELYVTVR